MNQRMSYVKKIFEEIPWGEEIYGFDHSLDIITDLVPGSDYFYREYFSNKKHNEDLIQRAKNWAKKQSELGLKIYILDDDDENIHMLAMTKMAEPFIRALKDYLQIMYVEEINWRDLSWD